MKMAKQGVLLITICCCLCKGQIISRRWNSRDFGLQNGHGVRPFLPDERYTRPGISDVSAIANLRFNEQTFASPRNVLTSSNGPPFNRLVSTNSRSEANRNLNHNNRKVNSGNGEIPVISRSEERNGNVAAHKICTPVGGQMCSRQGRRLDENAPRVNRNMDRISSDLKVNNNALLPKDIANIDNPQFSNLNNREIEDNSKTGETPTDKVEKLSTKIGSNACSCYWKPEKCGCDCEGSFNYDDFQEVSRNFFPCHSFTFRMSGGDHYALPPNFFSKMKNVEEFNLLINNATFEYICDPTPMTSPFKGVTFTNSALIKLTSVSVRRGWNWKPFEQLQSSSNAQVNIILEDCKLRRLTSDFSNLAAGHVDTVDISNSNLEMVGSNAFGTFENMTHFRVPNNKIQQLRRSDFPDFLSKLEEIDLRHNELRYLDDNFFTNMPTLKEILLSGNPINVLPENTFHSIISQANLVGISDIPLTCDCRLQWLKDSMLYDDATRKNMEGAVCKRPSYLRGIPFDYLSREHLRCV